MAAKRQLSRACAPRPALGDGGVRITEARAELPASNKAFSTPEPGARRPDDLQLVTRPARNSVITHWKTDVTFDRRYISQNDRAWFRDAADAVTKPMG